MACGKADGGAESGLKAVQQVGVDVGGANLGVGIKVGDGVGLGCVGGNHAEGEGFAAGDVADSHAGVKIKWWVRGAEAVDGDPDWIGL